MASITILDSRSVLDVILIGLSPMSQIKTDSIGKKQSNKTDSIRKKPDETKKRSEAGRKG